MRIPGVSMSQHDSLFALNFANEHAIFPILPGVRILKSNVLKR
jgi:hypothetical protein